jgi:hypothetical protein
MPRTTKDKDLIYKIRFKTFWPACSVTATTQLNEWLEENPNVEIISWQTCPVGEYNNLYITIQYREEV